MTNVFDETASSFAKGTDAAIEAGRYLRGSLFLDFTRDTVPAGSSIMDYGCGPGRIGISLARSGYRVLGVDTAEEMIQHAQNLDRHGLDIEFQYIRNYQDIVGHDVFDAIVCSSVIEYVPDPQALLQHFHNSLRASGVLIISYANRSSLWRRYWRRGGARNPMDGEHGSQVWDWDEFCELLSMSGFAVLRQPKFFDSPLDSRFGPLVSRLSLAGQLGITAVRRL